MSRDGCGGWRGDNRKSAATADPFAAITAKTLVQ
jgi:hypothetical protein